MNILVIGGTRFFGVPMVERLLQRGERVTIATRGLARDGFGNRVERLRLDLREEDSVRSALRGRQFDVVIDKMGYCSNEMRWILESLECGRFLHMSTAGVYRLEGMDIPEEAFNGAEGDLLWCGRQELDYDSVKRNAERALCQVYRDRNWVSVRAPFVLGRNDYTGRLRFYVEHVLRGKPMWIDDLRARFCVAECDELADFFVFLTYSALTGAVNACSAGTISLEELLRYVEERSGVAPILEPDGDPAPYNGMMDNSLSTNKAAAAGFRFRDVHEWIYRLLDDYIDEVRSGRE